MNIEETEKALSRRSQRVRPVQAADFLKVSIRTLEDWRAKGKGPPFSQVGRKIFYDMDDLVGFLSSSKQYPASLSGPTNVAPL